MNNQPSFLILVVIIAVIGGGWLFIQMVGACIAILSVGLGCGPDFAVVAGFFLALTIAVLILTRKNK